MISPRTAILPLLLLLTSGSAVYALPATDNILNVRALGDLTDEQRQKLDDLQMDDLQCVQKCADAIHSTQEPYIPLCAITDQSKEENDQDVKNVYSCLCTDKVYLASSLGCFVKTVSHPQSARASNLNAANTY